MYTVYWQTKEMQENGKESKEQNYYDIQTAEYFASFCDYASVYSHEADETVSYWQFGKEV